MTRQVFVRKSDKTEKFNDDKIINSLLNVGLQASLAVSIATEIFEEIKNNVSDTEIEISSKEIKAKVYEKLNCIDNKLADKYLKGNTTKVRTSLSTFEDFDANKITRSLIEETDIDEKIAERISKTVKKQMGKLNLEFVTAPLIREIVCVELLKGGFENERKLYTRLGMPVYDVTFLIEHGSKENANLQFNPETIHKLMADQISKEYSLIKVLPLELADAHMSGEIHIHDTDYFCLDKNEKIWTVNPTPKFTTIGEWINNNINDNDANNNNNNAHFKIFSSANGIAKPAYVSELFKRKNDENLCKISLDNGDDIKVTNQHRFFSLGLKNKEFLEYPFIDKLSNLHLKDGFYNQERSKFKVLGKIKSSKFLDIILNQILCGRNDDKEKRIIFRTEFGDIVEDALENLGIPFTKKYISKESRTKSIVINSKVWYEILMNLCNYMKTEEITADNLKKGMLVEVPREIVIDEKDEIKEINILEHIIKNKSKILAEDEFLIKNIGVKYTDGTIKSLEDTDKINGQETELIITYDDNPKINYSIPVFLKIDDGLVTVIAGVVMEGWLSKTHLKNRNPVYGVSFSNKDKNIIKKFNLAAESIFGKHPKNYLRENGVTTVAFGSKIAYLLFKYAFSIGEYAKNKKLPDFTIMINEYNIKSLLDFFKKCDGNSMDEYYTSSEDLASQIKWLLRRLGKGCLTHKQQNMFIIKESENKYISFKDANFVCVKEKNISDKPEYVYDLSCPDARRYLVGASPVYVHNSTRPFCFSHDIRFFLKHGLKVDGVGNHTAVAGPAKKPDVAFLHAAKVLASAQVNCAGGQGFSYFNTFLAPYITGLPYEKVKQLAQMFIYEMSMMYVARGGQSIHYDDFIWIKKDEKLKSVKIGEFVDKVLESGNPVKNDGMEILRLKDDTKTVSLDLKTMKFKEFNITAVSRHKPKKDMLYKIKTKSGKSVRVTDFHSIYTFKDGIIKKVKASELKEGDFVITPKGFDLKEEISEIDLIKELKKNAPEEILKNIYVKDNDIKIPFTEFSGSPNGKYIGFGGFGNSKSATRSLEMPAIIRLDDDILTLLGLFIGDGSFKDFSSKNVYIFLSIPESEGLDSFISKAVNKLGYNNLKRINTVDLSFGSMILKVVFQYVLNTGRTSEDRSVPPIIFSLSKKQIMAFLKGLYSSDGWASKSNENTVRIGYNTINEKLAHDLSFLLSEIGIIPDVHLKDRTNKNILIKGISVRKVQMIYDLQINSYEQKRIFAKSIGFLQKEKQNLVNEILTNEKLGKISKQHHTRRLPNDLIYAAFRDLNVLVPESIRTSENLYAWNVERELAKIPHNTPASVKFVEDLIESHISLDEIVSIERTKASEYVYDLEVNPNGEHIENFLGGFGSILVSNTVFSSIDCDMEVPEQFKDIPAVLPGGIVKENTTYADFEDETKTLFNAFIDVYLQGDFTGKAFNFPKFEVQIYPKKINKNEDMLLKVSQLAAKFGTPYYIINQPYMPLYACYQSLPYDEKVWIIKGEELHLVRIGEYINELMDEEMKEKGHINLGKGFEGEVEIAESQDYVFSFNPKTLKIEKKKIGKVMRHPKEEEIIRFHLAFNKDITVTSNHKLIVEEKGKLIEKRAKNIKPGDRLIGIRNMKKVIEELKLNVVEYEDKNANAVYREVGASWYTNLVGSNVTLKPGEDGVSIYHTLDRFGYDYAFSNLAIYEVRTIEFVIKGDYVYDFADVEDYHNFTNVYGIFSSNCCSFLMPLTDANTEDDVRDGTIRGGGLQVVTINLPQIAYESNHSEDKFFEILKDRMEKAKRVHLLKREIIKKNQNLGMLPFMSQIVNKKGDKYLEVDRQSFIMGLVGMNECVKFMTDCELHEDAGWKFGLKVMNAMKGIVADIRKETGLTFSLARTPAESCSYRLAQIDCRIFPDKFIANGDGKDAYYTNSFHVRPSANIPLWKRLTVEGSFHPLTDGGAMSHIFLGEQNPDPEAILSLTKKIAAKTAIQYMDFTKDLTVCSNCNFVTGGLHNKCPSCNSENVEWWSRITGYYQNIKGWNKGKLKELQDRRRYGFENNDKITAKEISFTMKEGDYEARFEKLKEKLKYDTSLDF